MSAACPALVIAAALLAVLGFEWNSIWTGLTVGRTIEDNVRTSIMMAVFLLAG